LQRARALSRLERAFEAHRALHAARPRHARVVRDARRSAHLGTAVDVRDASHPRRIAAAVRVRVPRRQLRAREHSVGCARRRGSAASAAANERRGTVMNEFRYRAALPAQLLAGLAAAALLAFGSTSTALAQPAGQMKSLSHNIHAVNDLDTTLAFYRDVFGFE